MCFWPLKTTFSAKCAKQIPERIGGGGAPCFGGRTISFWVKFESSVLCTLEAYIGHLEYFVPHFYELKSSLWFQRSKKNHLKNRKRN